MVFYHEGKVIAVRDGEHDEGTLQVIDQASDVEESPPNSSGRQTALEEWTWRDTLLLAVFVGIATTVMHVLR